MIRGDDLVPSTPRQVLLSQALGWPIPNFGHVPLAVGPNGRRLAKRDGAIKLATLRVAPGSTHDGWSAGWHRRAAGPTMSYPRSRAIWIGRFDLASLP